jgi:hypothetical protein
MIDAVLDSLYDDVDDAFRAGRFAEVDVKIAALDVEALPIVLLLGWLTITHAAAEKLPARAGFTIAVVRRLTRESGIDDARDLLQGLVEPHLIPIIPIELLASGDTVKP